MSTADCISARAAIAIARTAIEALSDHPTVAWRIEAALYEIDRIADTISEAELDLEAIS